MPDERENKISCANFLHEMEVALEVLSGKWKAVILWRLHEEEHIRFNEFLRVIPGITQKMLTQQLRSLEKNNLISRKIYPSIPPIVEYSLTPLAQECVPLLEQLNQWGQEVINSYEKNEEPALSRHQKGS